MADNDVVSRLKNAHDSKEMAELVSITPDAEKVMAFCARVSNPNNQLNEKSSKLLSYCIKNRHWSVFEQAMLTIQVKTSRAISAQILRHRSFTMQEFSQRYSAVDASGVVLYAARRQDDKNRQNSVDDLADEVKQEWHRRQQENWSSSFAHYTWALDNGIAKECARMVLPLATQTTLYMTGSVRSWIHYLDTRCGNGTQQEHMEVANACKEIFKRELPVVAEALGW